MKGLEDTYIEMSQSRLQIRIKCFDVRSIYFDVNGYSDKPTDMKPNFDELKVMAQGLSNSRVLPRLSLHW
jgi:hypothetical protein